MLGKPQHGWTCFSIDGEGGYDLSYLTDIPFVWIEQAISGLENMRPFCVCGYLEPGRCICTVSFYGCYVVIEDEDNCPLNDEDIVHKHYNIGMLDFCRRLYDDISADLDGWASFDGYASFQNDEYFEEKKQRLIELLDRLKKLTDEKAHFLTQALIY